jgi:hypothetical protein
MNLDQLTRTKYRYRIYTGPCIVREVADRLSQAYLHVICIGTAHVYIDTNHDAEHILRVLGPTWTHRDIHNVRRTQ